MPDAYEARLEERVRLEFVSNGHKRDVLPDVNVDRIRHAPRSLKPKTKGGGTATLELEPVRIPLPTMGEQQGQRMRKRLAR